MGEEVKKYNQEAAEKTLAAYQTSTDYDRLRELPGSHTMDFDHTEMNANAYLIAAAPEMYRMLEDLHDLLVGFTNDAYFYNCDKTGDLLNSKASEILQLLNKVTRKGKENE